MANKRQLKKDISYLCGELLAECVSCRHYTSVNLDAVHNVMLNILNMQDDMICRVSHPEPGMKARDFFKKLRNDMAAQTSDIFDQINALI